jgi:predicted phage terminase large subunit-like protein
MLNATTKVQVITLAEFFEAHGLAEDKPRVILPFHRRILDAFADVIMGTLPGGKRNLMILIPPRHSKTFLARDFVSYGLGCFPDSQFIYTGYSATIAAEQTQAIRQSVGRDWYRAMFPYTRMAKSAADHFTTTAGGQVYGVGMGGSITGFGAGRKRREFGGAIIIDDALKADDARSEAALKHCRDWYTGVLISRKNHTDTPVILIQQRLHPDDLAGHLIATEGDQWHVIRIPGLQADGTALWPETKSAQDLERLKRVDEFTFWSQYQQEPIMPGGNMIKRDWWRYYNPHTYDVNCLVFMTADTAMKAKTSNDPSSLQCWHATPTHLDLLEDHTGRWEFPDLMRNAVAFWRKWEKFGTDCMYIEDKASGPSLAQMLHEQGIPVKLWKPGDYDFPNDKVGRVKHSMFYIEAGRVRLPDNDQPWVRPFIDELAAFTGDDTVHDDRTDAATIACSVWSWKGGASDIKVG